MTASLSTLTAFTHTLPCRTTSSLSVVVVGASGDLAKKKIFPALFALYYEGLLPEVRRGVGVEVSRRRR